MIIYVAHCIGSGTKEGIQENLNDLYRILKIINMKYPDVVPLAPYIGDVLSLDDHLPEHRQRGLNNGLKLIETGVFDELWLTGPKLSSGMTGEVNKFNVMDLPIIDKINFF